LRELIIIGPEGGFSSSERELILSLKHVVSHYLPVNILRASTALPVSVGYIIGKRL
jgi:RsmE family RNA methyltransferase